MTLSRMIDRDTTRPGNRAAAYARMGLKKPIQVSRRAAEEGEGPRYDLVCGQGLVEPLSLTLVRSILNGRTEPTPG